MAVIKNDRDKALQLRGVDGRVMNPLVTVGISSTTPTGVPYFTFVDNSTSVVTPASITLTATANSAGSYTSPTYAWYYSTAMDPVTWISLGVTTTACTVTGSNFITQLSTGDNVNYKVVVSQAGWTTTSTITSVMGYKNINSAPVVSISKDSILLPTVGSTVDYTSSTTDITVSIGGTNLNYDTTNAVANTFTVTASASGITVDAAPTTVTSTIRRFAAAFSLVSLINPGYITYTVTVRDIRSKVYTFTKVQSIMAGVAGLSAKMLSIMSDSLIFSRDNTNTITGPSSIKFTANKQNTTNTVTWATSPAVTLYTAATGGSITTTGDIVYMRSGDYAANTYVTVTASIAADSLTDTASISSVKSGSYALTAVLSNVSAPLPTTSAGVTTFTGSGTTIQVYEGNVLRTITAVTPTTTNVTAGAITGTPGTIVTVADHTAISANNGSVKYALTVTRGDGTSDSSISVTQAVYKSLQGAVGGNGSSTVTVQLFSNTTSTVPTANAATYTITGNVMGGTYTNWSLTQPTTTTSPTYMTSASVVTSTPGVAFTIPSWTTAVPVAQLATNGSNGSSTAVVELFSNTTSTVPAANATTYTLSTNTMGGTYTNWSLSMPTTTTSPTYMTTAAISTSTPASPFTIPSWTAAVVAAQLGTNGTDGTKAITVSAFLWAASAPTITSTPFTYTWAGGAITYPTNGGTWTASAGTPVNGYTLYQLNLVITASANATTTAVNWTSATMSSIGYRSDGTIGPIGGAARTAYLVNTSSTVPGAVTAGSGDVAPIGWGYTATSTLTAGQYMYRVDGTYANGGNVTWGNPYLANLKVGSLSAIAADLGSVSISTTGSLYSGTKTYGDNVNGIFLGYSGSFYKFQVGASNSSGISWDGGQFAIRATDGSVLIHSGLATTDFMNSAVTPATLGVIRTDLVGAPASILNINVVAGGGNLCTNANFAVTTTGYAGGGIQPVGFQHYNNQGVSTTHTVSSGGGAIGGANYWRMLATSAGSVQYGFFLSGAFNGGWQNNVDYVFSFYARVSSSLVGANFTMGWNHGPAFQSFISNPATTTSWQRYTIQVNFGANTLDANGFVTISTTMPVGQYIDFSCIQIETGLTPSGWHTAPWISSGGVLQGMPGFGTIIDNSSIAISGGNITGIGSGNNTAVANSSIVIGGRNLLTNSQTMVGNGWTSSMAYTGGQTDPMGGTSAVLVTSNGSDGYLLKPASGAFKTLGEHTVSVWLKGDKAGGIYLQTQDQSIRTYCAVTTSWQKFSVTGTVTSLTPSYSIVIGGWGTWADASFHVYVAFPKLEEGNKATDWTPAPEDVAAGIATAATTANYGNLTGTPSTAIANSNITVTGGTINNIGTGAGTVVDNQSITIDAAGTLNGVGTTGKSVANNRDYVIMAPGGGVYTTQTPTVYGALKIQLPSLMNGNYPMLKFVVDIYEYSTGWSCKLEIGGHTSGWLWYNEFAQVIGGNTEYPVYFGHDGTHPCVWISGAGESWNYPQVRVHDVFVGYSSGSVAIWENSWVISFDTAAATNVSRTVTDTYPGANWTKIAGTNKPADNANNTSIDGSGLIQGVSSGVGTSVANGNITITSGAINGIGTGTGTAVANGNISLSQTGILYNAGGGQVITLPTLDNDREGNPAPNVFNIGTTKQFKHAAAIGLSDANGYWVTLETIIQYPSGSGGYPGYQYVYQHDKTWRRRATDDSGTAWGAWVQDLDRNAYTGTLDANTTSISGGVITGVAGAGNGAQVENSYLATGQNRIPNSDQSATITWGVGVVGGMTFDWNGSSGSYIGYAKYTWTTANYALSGSTNNLWVHQNNNSGAYNTSAMDIYPMGGWDIAHTIPIVGGQKYIFSVYVQTHRCYVGCGLYWFDGSGAQIGSILDTGPVSPTYTGNIANNLELYTRIYVSGVAPSGATCCNMYIRKFNTSGGGESYLWMAAPQLEAVAANATIPGPYTSGPIASISQLGYTGTMNATTNQSDTATNDAISTAGTTATWSGVSSKPSNIAALSGGEALNNALISLGTLGAGAMATINQITGANIGTYIADAAIGSAYIGSVNAATINAGFISADRIQVGTATVSAASGLVTSQVNIPNTTQSAVVLDSGTLMTLTSSGSPVTVTITINYAYYSPLTTVNSINTRWTLRKNGTATTWPDGSGCWVDAVTILIAETTGATTRVGRGSVTVQVRQTPGAVSCAYSVYAVASAVTNGVMVPWGNAGYFSQSVTGIATENKL